MHFIRTNLWLMLLTTPAFALGPMQNLKHLRAVVATKIPTKIAADKTCADFSGQWAGTCASDDGTEDKEDRTVKIEQDGCDLITIDGNTYPIGGSMRMIVMSPAENSDAGLVPRLKIVEAYLTC